MMDAQQVKNIVEACLLVAGRAMSLRQIDDLFEGDDNRPDKATIKTVITELQADYEGRGIELVEVASGYRLQSRTEVADWVARLFPEKAPRYSRALLETLVLVAYRQPITRGEIEEIRGVAVSSNIIKTLQEREWVKEVGFKDVPGKPALLGTTKQFLDYFNLKRLDDLPPLSEIKSLDELDAALVEAAGIAPHTTTDAANDEEVSAEEESTEAAEGAQASTDDADQSQQSNDPLVAQTDDEISEHADAEPEKSTDIEATDENPVSDSDDVESDEPVTFAGIMSRLPSLNEHAVDVVPTANESSEESSSDEQVSADENATAEEVDAEEVSAEDAVAVEVDVEVAEDSSTEVSDAQSKMLSTLTELANEHRQEMAARDEIESQLPARSASDAVDLTLDVDAAELVEVDEVDTDISDTTKPELQDSDEVSDSAAATTELLPDTLTGEPASARDTLH